MAKIYEFIIGHPKQSLAFLAVAVLYVASWIPKMQTDPSIRSFIMRGDPDYAFYNQYKEKFGQDQVLVIAFEDNDIFTPDNLAVIRRLTGKTEKLDDVFDVKSLTNVEYMKGTEDSFESVRLVGDDIPTDGIVLDDIRRRAVSNPLYCKDLISADARRTAILITLRAKGEDFLYDGTITALETLIAEEKQVSHKTFFLAGERYMDRKFLEYIRRDLSVFMPLSMLLVVVSLVLMFRNLRDTLIGVTTLICCLMTTMGLIPLTGWKMDSVNSGLPPLIMCIAVLYVIHVIHRYRVLLHTFPDRKTALIETMKSIGGAMCLASLITAVGFASNITSGVRPIIGFSLLAAMGIASSFVITTVAVPSMLMLFGNDNPEKDGQHKQLVPLRMLVRLADLMLKRKWVVASGCLSVLAVAILGIPQLVTQADRTRYLRKSSDAYKSMTFIENNLAGVNQLDVWIEGGREGIIKEPDTLNQIEDLSQFLRVQPKIDKVVCINDFLKEMNKAFYKDDPKQYKLPETRDNVAQFLLMYSMSGRKNDLDKYVDYPYSRTRISIRTSEHNSANLDNLIGTIDRYLSVRFKPPLKAKIASLVLANNNIFHSMLSGMGRSLVTDTLVISFIVCLGFRSFRAGLACMIPNLTPVIACLGLMGWLGIWLEVSTAMTFSIALGLTVDDTIHFITIFKHELEKGNDEAHALHTAVRLMGSVMIEAAIIMMSSFLILVFASLKMNMLFGLLTAFILLMAVLTDLLITPICLITIKPFHAQRRKHAISAEEHPDVAC